MRRSATETLSFPISGKAVVNGVNLDAGDQHSREEREELRNWLQATQADFILPIFPPNDGASNLPASKDVFTT